MNIELHGHSYSVRSPQANAMTQAVVNIKLSKLYKESNPKSKDTLTDAKLQKWFFDKIKEDDAEIIFSFAEILLKPLDGAPGLVELMNSVMFTPEEFASLGKVVENFSGLLNTSSAKPPKLPKNSARTKKAAH